ncbi:MAG: hypothetical protein ACOY4I_08935 [Bacillota bacterium]
MDLANEIQFPPMAKVQQRWSMPRVSDIASTVRQELKKLKLDQRIAPGQTVAITAGSRGIANITAILIETVRFFLDIGARPYLVSAMGSHGGGSPEGQEEVLKSLGITSEAMGAPLHITSDTVVLGETPSGHTVYCDRHAAGADAVFPVNRVKPHTSFRGSIESGLQKIVAVGLGKHPGARSVHALGPENTERTIREIYRYFAGSKKIVGGLAILENAREETAKIAALPPEEMEPGEQMLLREAKALLPRLPVDEIDLLIVEEMGKNYSGTGMDTNVIGRLYINGIPEPETPKIKRLAALDLSAESHGNATGIGFADFVTKRLLEKIDYKATYLNCLTTTFVRRAAVPMILKDDREAISIALYSLSLDKGRRPRVVRIANTLHLEHIQVSENLLPEVLGDNKCILISNPGPMQFDSEGRII